MGRARVTGGVREIAGKQHDSLQEHTNWLALIRNDSTIANEFDAVNASLAKRAATETDTRCYIAPDVNEASSLLVENRRRIIIAEQRLSSHGRSVGTEKFEPQRIGEEERRRAENIIKAGGVVVALADKSRESGLSDFWKRYDELKKERSSFESCED